MNKLNKWSQKGSLISIHLCLEDFKITMFPETRISLKQFHSKVFVINDQLTVTSLKKYTWAINLNAWEKTQYWPFLTIVTKKNRWRIVLISNFYISYGQSRTGIGWKWERHLSTSDVTRQIGHCPLGLVSTRLANGRLWIVIGTLLFERLRS